MATIKEKIAALAESLQGDWFQADWAGYEGKLIEVLNSLVEGTNSKYETTDITSLDSSILDLLDAGDMVIKVDNTGKHTYIVSYRGEGGLCLTYTDCENVETVAYNKGDSGWTYDDTTVTHIAS